MDSPQKNFASGGQVIVSWPRLAVLGAGWGALETSTAARRGAMN
jgi:hypothetical protein